MTKKTAKILALMLVFPLLASIFWWRHNSHDLPVLTEAINGKNEQEEVRKAINPPEKNVVSPESKYSWMSDVISDVELRNRPESDAELWGELVGKTYKSDTLRFFQLTSFLYGRSNLEKIEELRGMILESFGKGDFRDKLIGSLYPSVVVNSGLDAIPQLLSTLSQFENEFSIPKVRMSLISGLGDISTSQISSYFHLNPDVIKNLIDSSDAAKSFAQAIGSTSVGNKDGDPGTIIAEGSDLIQTIFEKSEYFESMMASFCVSNSYSAPLASWELIRKNPEILNSSDTHGPIKFLIDKMVSMDGAAALTALSSTEKLPHEFLQNAFAQWVNRDSRVAKEWFDEATNNPSMSGNLDDLRAGFVNSAVDRAEFSTGQEWVESIEDDELRKKAKEKLWIGEKAIVLEKAKADPVGVIDSIVSGTSGHADYWIKQAFDEWVSTSPENAASWYDEKRSILTPAQNQHVARVYADRAIEQGDVNTATQWLNLVNEEQFRQPLEDRIKAIKTGETARNLLFDC